MDRIPHLKDPDRSLTRITGICTNPNETEGTEMKNREFCGLAQMRTKETKAKSGD